jgi:hypothetical protein
MRIATLLLAALCLPAGAAEQSGAEVFDTTCIKCHGEGKDGAPVFGNRKQWGKLVREGLNELVPTALTGIRKMPAPGRQPCAERWRSRPRRDPHGQRRRRQLSGTGRSRHRPLATKSRKAPEEMTCRN